MIIIINQSRSVFKVNIIVIIMVASTRQTEWINFITIIIGNYSISIFLKLVKCQELMAVVI